MLLEFDSVSLQYTDDGKTPGKTPRKTSNVTPKTMSKAVSHKENIFKSGIVLAAIVKRVVDKKVFVQVRHGGVGERLAGYHTDLQVNDLITVIREVGFLYRVTYRVESKKKSNEKPNERSNEKLDTTNRDLKKSLNDITDKLERNILSKEQRRHRDWYDDPLNQTELHISILAICQCISALWENNEHNS